MKQIVFQEHAIERARERGLARFIDPKFVVDAVAFCGIRRDAYYRKWQDIVFVCKSSKDKIFVKTLYRRPNK